MNFSEEQAMSQELANMKRMLRHAIDMNGDGRLSAKELDEFRRWIVGQSLDKLDMEQYRSARDSGEFERLRAYAGQNVEDAEEMEGPDLERSRKGISEKILADYLGRMLEAGHINSTTYVNKMRKAGLAPEGEEADAMTSDDLAKMIASGEQMPGPPANPMAVDDAYVEEFRKRSRRRQ